jgi:hypothetical protein
VELTAHSYCPRANACATKPINPVELLGAMTAIEQFWVEILKLP